MLRKGHNSTYFDMPSKISITYLYASIEGAIVARTRAIVCLEQCSAQSIGFSKAFGRVEGFFVLKQVSHDAQYSDKYLFIFGQ